MTFKEAKQIIRRELTLASNEKLAEIIDAARAGEMPWMECNACLAGKLSGSENWWKASPLSIMGHIWHSVSDAYYEIGSLGDEYEDDGIEDCRRQRVLTTMAMAELRARHRAQDLVAATEVQSLAELLGA